MRVRHLRMYSGQKAWSLLGVVGIWLASSLHTQGQDPYFRRTRSDANVYVAPVGSSIEKVAVLPFKAPTELIGSSISDIFVTEMLRAKRYTLVERGQIDRVVSRAEMREVLASILKTLMMGRNRSKAA